MDTRQYRTLQDASSDETSVLWTDAPAIAATGVDMVNDSKTTKWVRITGGTVTVVKTGIPGNTTTIQGLTTGDWIPVRPGHALNLTYSVVPTSLQWFES